METYTHNMKIILVDASGNMAFDHDYLTEIKKELCTLRAANVVWNNKTIPVSVQWTKKHLNYIDEQFMGDLFTHSVYDYDSVVIDHAKQIISSVKNKTYYTARFYISRLVGDKSVCPHSFGVA